MLALRRLLRWVLLLAPILTAPGAILAQDASSDQAKALLAQGIEQFKKLSFQAAQETFLKVDRQVLSEQQQATLDAYLRRVGPAIQKQTKALEAYDAAEKALQRGNVKAAREGFAVAAASEYLRAANRHQARDQLALAQRRLEAAAAAEAEPVTQPAAQPPKAESPVDEETLRRMAAIQRRRAQAEDFLTKGDAAMAAGQYEQAAWYFQRAVDLQPEWEEAKQKLRYARQQAATGRGGDVLSQFVERRRADKQRADTIFEKYMSQARERLLRAESKEDFQAAGNSLARARETIEPKKSLYTPEEYRQRLTRIENLGNEMAQRRREWEKDRADEQRRQMIEAERVRRQQAETRLLEQIRDLETQARTLQAQQSYEPALGLIERILKLDPRNGFAMDNKTMLQQLVYLSKEYKLDRLRNLEEQKNQVGIRESEIPWYELVIYPDDWKEITKRREPFDVTLAESIEDRALKEKLKQVLPKVDFENIEFPKVLKWLQDVSGVNIAVKWAALEAGGIDPASLVDLRLTNVTVEKVLESVLEQVGGITPLGYILDRGVVTISTKDDLKRKTFVNVYDIRDLIYRVPNVGKPETLGLPTTGGAGEGGDFGDGGDGGGLFETTTGGGGGGEEEGMSKAELVTSIIDAIRETIDPQSWPPVGTIGAIRELNGQLIVTQTAENHQALLDLINMLREARAIQIAIEARFVSVSSGFLNAIGVDLDFFFNLGSRLGSATVVDPWTTAVVPTRTGLSGWGRDPAGSNTITPIPITQGSNLFAGGTGVATPILSGTSIASQVTEPALNVFGTFLDDIQVAFVLTATQAHSDTRALVAPRLTVFNGQAAEIIVETQQAYISDLEPETTENVVSWDMEVDTVATGARLWVEATVSADRRYVTITVVPQVTNLVSLAFFPYDPTPLIAAGTPPPSDQPFLQLPTVEWQTLQTTVSVPDGGTLLLGGQKLSGEVEREMGVPVLSKIPILNRLFDNRSFTRDERTLLVLIKPTIIIQREEEEKAFP